MATARVTGNYVTSADVPLPPGVVPRVELIPSRNAVTTWGRAISMRPQESTIHPVTGYFQFDVIPTTRIYGDDFHYLVRGFYLDPDGYGAGGGYTRRDLFEQEIRVPTGGGHVGDLSSKQYGNDLVYAAPDAVDLREQTGFQFNTLTGDLYQWKA